MHTLTQLSFKGKQTVSDCIDPFYTVSGIRFIKVCSISMQGEISKFNFFGSTATPYFLDGCQVCSYL